MSKENKEIKWRLDDGQIEVVDDKTASILKGKTPAERLEIVFGMWRSATVQLKFCKNLCTRTGTKRGSGKKWPGGFLMEQYELLKML